MPRRPYKKITVKADSIYNSLEVEKLINFVMRDGKKTIAQKIVYKVFDQLKNQKLDPLKVLHLAIGHVAPSYEVKPRRLGGASYLVPTEVRKDRKLYLALNWILEAADARPNKEYHLFSDKLLAELIDASKNQGQAVNKRLQTEKLAEANKAFAHLRW